MHVGRQNVDFCSLFDHIFGGAFLTELFLLPTHGRAHILEGICAHKVLISRLGWFRSPCVASRRPKTGPRIEMLGNVDKAF